MGRIGEKLSTCAASHTSRGYRLAPPLNRTPFLPGSPIRGRHSARRSHVTAKDGCAGAFRKGYGVSLGGIEEDPGRQLLLGEGERKVLEIRGNRPRECPGVRSMVQ